MTVTPSRLSRCQSRLRYPSKSRPLGKFGAHVITVTRCPIRAHSRQCSNVRLAGAFTSGGKLSVKKRMCISHPKPASARSAVGKSHDEALHVRDHSEALRLRDPFD